jgi:hypothetical protein
MKGKKARGKQLIKIGEIAPESMNLEESQLAEQLYSSAGLDPVVDAGLKDYDSRLEMENKLISKVLGPRGSDIKGYGEAVAKRVAFAVYTLLNKQYGGKVGDLRSYLMALEEERDRANTKYDELLGRVVGILGDEYKELRTDSQVFMEKLTTVLGEDLKESKIDNEALAARLADIDGLRSQVKTLVKEKEQLEEGHKSQIAELDSRIEGLESEKTTLTADLTNLKEAVTALSGEIPYEEIKEKIGQELYQFLLHDSKVPDMVIDGVGKFIDFKKYLGMAAEKGAGEASRIAEKNLSEALLK